MSAPMSDFEASEFEFEFRVNRWRLERGMIPSWQCGNPHFLDFPPECRVQAYRKYLTAIDASNNTAEALAYYKARDDAAKALVEKEERDKAHRAQAEADHREMIRQVNARASAYMRGYRAAKKALRPVKVPFNRRAYMRTYMRQYRNGQ